MTIPAKDIVLQDSLYARLVLPVSAAWPSSIAGTDFELPVFYAPAIVADATDAFWTGEFGRSTYWTVKGVFVTGDAAMTGATATATTLLLRKYTSAGVLVGTVASLAFITGTNLVAFQATSLGALTAANAVIKSGEVLTIQKTHASTGTATPNILVTVDLA